ncbi:MAG: DNA polymerase III subunit alpha [Dehalococcoidia bacterium]|nr:DNA polymerase III subunit alpha [Dehalococcoidia bacterium]
MFAHLHTHSEYSLLDGLSKIPELVARAQQLGQQALAITDHGALYGAIELYETARAAGVKPIIGLEAYVAPGSRRDRSPAAKTSYHLTLLAQNERGYRNLLKLSTASHLEGFYYKPRVDRELLEQHSEGLFALSGCPSGELMTALADGREQDALDAAGWYRDVFRGRYYVELQEHEQDQFSRLTPSLVQLARRLELPLVLTNDSHYTRREQQHAHDVLLCIGTNATMLEESRFRLEGDSFYLKSEQEMRALFPDLPEAADNSARIAEQVDIKLEFGRTQLPDAGVPAGMSPAAYLRQLCDEGVRRRYRNLTAEQRDRLDYELNVIEQTGFVEYMLIVRDIARFARERGIPMGVRGSAAASMVLHCLDVTDIEPTQYRLVFERFLNPERSSMPDVDFDFADDRRDEVIRYTAERFGHDRVAQIVTFGTLGAKAAIRDTGRALGMPYGEVDRIARMIPDTLHVTIAQALDEVQELRDAVEAEEPVRALIDTARGLEGVARHASTHAAGVVITREPLTEVVPLQRATTGRDSGRNGEQLLPTTQYAMADVETIGLLKLDFLGLTNLSILGRAVQLIRERRGEALDLLALPDGDPDTAALLAAAETFGVFQMESAGMRRYVAELQPRDIREVAAMVALYRPGPMEHIPSYIEAKHGRAAPHYLHADLAAILDETYGVITYQDQVLEIAKRFAGYTLGQADVMRKAMGKKIPAVMLAERERFVAGSQAQGYERRLAEQLFDLIEPFAGYAFNKAHAFSYGVIAYQTAYLKAHYPVEFMTAVVMASGGSQDRIAAARAECTRLGIRLLAPNVNRSASNFAIEADERGEPAIRYGLAQIKNVGAGAIEQLLAERAQGGPFDTLEAFARRVNPHDLNRRALESLAKAGALDTLGDRASIVAGLDRILSLAQQEQRLRETGQSSMFDLFGSEVDTPLPALELEPQQAPRQELLAWEKELLGTYISEHPFQQAGEALRGYVTAQAAELTAELAGQEATVAGTLTRLRRLVTRQGKPFAAAVLEDLSGAAELTVWPDGFERFRDLLVEGTVLLARVEIRQRGERLTLAVLDLTAYDQDVGELVNFEPSRFVPRTTRRGPGGGPRGFVHPGEGRESASDRGGGSGANGHGATRPALRAVEPAAATDLPAPEPPAPQAVRAAEAASGSPRLLIAMEETTDAVADRGRLQRLIELLGAHPGELPVELAVHTRGGRTERLRLDGVAAGEELVPRIRTLLGVLGEVWEAGERERAGALAAAGGA